jgi:hypothetical protein
MKQFSSVCVCVKFRGQDVCTRPKKFRVQILALGFKIWNILGLLSCCLKLSFGNQFVNFQTGVKNVLKQSRLNLIQVSQSEAEKESDTLTEDFLEGKITNIDEFLESFMVKHFHNITLIIFGLC